MNQITDSSFTAANETLRSQFLSGVSNFRDLGGYAAADGRRVRTGIVYRSNQLSRASEADVVLLRGLDIRAICDLRSVRERHAQPTPERIATAIHGSAKPDTDFIFEDIFAHTPHEVNAWAEAFARFYGDSTEYYADEFGLMFRLILGRDLPMVVHCSAGKDRTGVACALLLSALGVDRATVMADYLFTSARLDEDVHFKNMLSDAKLNHYAALPPECRDVMLGTSERYLGRALDTLDARYGSLEDYLNKRLGIDSDDLARLRDVMLEG